MVWHRYTKAILQEAVNNSTSLAGVIRYLGRPLAGGTQTHIKNRILEDGIDISHFLGQAHNKGKTYPEKQKTSTEILTVLPEGSKRIKRRMLERALLESGIPKKCALCPVSDSWNSLPIVLEVDHIDGNWLDNTLENLRFLCPNCHSQQSNTNLPSKYKNWSNPRKICECGKSKQINSKQCFECHRKEIHQKKLDREVANSSIKSPEVKKKPTGKPKIEWPDQQKLIDLIAQIGYSALGARLGVSDNAIRKHLAKHASIIPRGYPQTRRK